MTATEVENLNQHLQQTALLLEQITAAALTASIALEQLAESQAKVKPLS